MDDSLDDLKNLWKGARRVPGKSQADPLHIIRMAEKQKMSTLRMHILNILILILAVLGLAAFFTYVASFSQLISHIGVALMIGSLSVRVMIELVSIYLSSKIDLSESAFKTNNTWLKFYRFRKRVHGPVTITILILYTIGFYVLTPEFSLYFSTLIMILIDLSYILGAAIFITFIRRAIRKEMRYLEEILALQREMNMEESL